MNIELFAINNNNLLVPNGTNRFNINVLGTIPTLVLLLSS